MTAVEQFRKLHAEHVSVPEESAWRSAAIMNHLGRVLRLLPPGANGLEIGCFKGGTTVWLLQNGIAQVDVIDPFTGNPEHQHMDLSSLRQEFDDNTKSLKDRIRVFTGRSDEVLPKLVACGATYDFIYVDGSHDSRDVIVDAELGWRLLKPSGAIVFDDYMWAYYEDHYRNPRPAIDFFLCAHGAELKLLERGYQVSVQKL